MNIKPRAFLLSLTIIAVLVFSAVGPTVAYADGETPPPDTAATEPAVEPVQPPETVDAGEPAAPAEGTGDGSAPVEEAATPLPAAEGEATPPPAEEAAPPAEGEAVVPETEAAPTEAAAPVTEAPPAEAAAPATEAAPAEAAPATEAPILDAVPENTTVTVLNPEGESQPLATQAAAEAIATTSDPIWCPAGQSPTPNANGCTQSFTSFNALLTFISGNATYSGAGTIYVQQGAYQGGESSIDFNNYSLGNISNASLTVTGGWNTTNNTIDPTNPTTLNGISLTIGGSTPWGGSLTINNLSISNTGGTGLNLSAQTDINLNNVSVTNSQNGAGAILDAGRDVNIRDSKFRHNRTAGVIITAGRDVSVLNTLANNDSNFRRQNVGLNITSGGAVSLANVTADQNRLAGATIDAQGRVSISNSLFSGTKEIIGSNFLGYGLQVVTPGAIDLDHVTANDNFLWGASLTAGGDVAIANSIFNLNTTESDGFIDDTGLLVTSGGNVSIINSQANDNRLIGATITATGDVSISNSQFNSNNGITLDSTGAQQFHGYGLQVVTQGNIFLNLVDASNNTLYGARLDAGGNVTISSNLIPGTTPFVTATTFSNNTTGSATDLLGRGLEIVSDGNVRIENMVLNNNQTFGANIQTSGIVILDNVTATNNGTNGVEVQANCTTVFLINGTYTGNGQYGLSILNGALNRNGGAFSGNGLGDIFQDPGTCVFATTPPPAVPPTTTPPTTTPPTAPVNNPVTTAAPSQQGRNSLAQTVQYSTASSNGAFKSAGGTLTAKNAVTLNGFLVNATTANGTTHIGLFNGMYAIVYFSDGSMQIIVLSPNSLDGLAMNGS